MKAAALAVAYVAAQASANATCPFHWSTTKFVLYGDLIKLVSNTLCPSSSTYECSLDAECAAVKDSSRYMNVYIGDYTNYSINPGHIIWSANAPQQSIVLTGNWSKLPESTKTLESFAIVNVSSDFKWPQSLENIAYGKIGAWTYGGSQPSDVVFVPPGVKSLALHESNFTLPADLKQLETLFATNFPKNMTIANANLSNFSDVTLDGVQQLVNVTFSKKLRSLNLGSSKIDNWIMDEDTFNVINRLTPKGNETLLTRALFTYSDGFAVNTTKASCANAGGKLEELFPYRIPIPTGGELEEYAVEQKTPYMICVVPKVSNITSPPPSTLPPSPPASQSSPSTTNVVAIISGSIGGLAVLALAIVLFRRHNVQNLAKPDPTGYTSLESPKATFDYQLLEPLRLENKDITLTQLLGSGAFADVWMGTFQGDPVAVKILHAKKIPSHQLQSFIDEILLMSTFDSPYIIKLIGAAWTRPSDMKCVMELMDGGDLKDYLNKNDSTVFSWRAKLDMIQDIAEGLVYLHSMNIIHRDLKSRNVLLDSAKGVKLSDFGVSKEDMQATMTMAIGTFRWMAPEVISGNSYTVASDVYSFGCVLSEVSTHLIPYEDLKNLATGQPVNESVIIVKVIAGGIKPSFSSDTPQWVYELALRCLSRNADDRPTAMEISHIIRAKIKEIPRGLHAF